MREENDRLREKIAALQQAKQAAEARAEERLKSKETLRSRLAAKQKSEDLSQLTIEQLSAKVTELREELYKLNRPTKRR